MKGVKRNILVVDDDPDIRAAVTEVLEESGYEVTAVDDAAAALARLAGSPELPSLILLDLMMPGMDGWTFRRHQRSYWRLAHIPTVIVTAARPSLFPDDRDLVAVIPKPVSIETLLDLAGRYCGAELKAIDGEG